MLHWKVPREGEEETGKEGEEEATPMRLINVALGVKCERDHLCLGKAGLDTQAA